MKKIINYKPVLFGAILGAIAYITPFPIAARAQMPPTVSPSSELPEAAELQLKALTLWNENKFEEALSLIERALAL